MGMALDMAGDVCDDRGMTATDQTTYFEQIADALSHLQIRHEREYRAILDEFPAAADLQRSGAHFDVEAMGIDDVEWVDWLAMAIEDSQRIVCTECS